MHQSPCRRLGVKAWIAFGLFNACTASARAQPRVEVLLDRSELRTSIYAGIDANNERILVDVPGILPDTLDAGVFDLRSQTIIDVISVAEVFEGPQPPYHQYRPGSWIVDFSEDLSTSVWGVDLRDRQYNPSYMTLARGPSRRWITPACEDQLHWFGHAISRDGQWVNSSYYGSASDYESWNEYFRVRWSTTTGECGELQRYSLGSGGSVVATDDDLRPIIIARVSGSWNNGEVVYRYVGGTTPEEIVRLPRLQDVSQSLANLVRVSISPPRWYMTIDEYDRNTGVVRQRAMQWQPGGLLEPIPTPAGWETPILYRLSDDGSRGVGTIRMATFPFWEVGALWTRGGGFLSVNAALAQQGLPPLRHESGSISRDGKRLLSLQWDSPAFGYGPLSVLNITDIFCDGLDFNNDGFAPDAQDAEDYLAVLAGGPGACSTGTNSCNDLDFNNDGVTPDDADLAAFLRRLGGGACDE